VTEESGRPRILELNSSAQLPGKQETLPHTDRIVLAVPDNDVLVKRLHIPKEAPGEIEDLVAFELSQSVIEDSKEFAFDYHPDTRQESYLGMIFRRDILLKHASLSGFDSSEKQTNLRYRMKGLAFGRAYQMFCRKEEGELVCLVNVSETMASLCFLYQQVICALAMLPLTNYRLDTTADQEQMAIDLKTMVNFQLAALMDDGISLPLSALVLSGELVSDELRHIIQKYFPVGVTTLSFHPGFFGNTFQDESVDLERFIIALGLTLN
jgi:hypothetical protein